MGGTGKEGSGLALRWAKAGARVVIGSRDPAKAERVAAELNARLGQDTIRGLGNREAAEQGDVVVLTVPYAAHLSTLAQVKDALAGKVLVDVTVPLDPENVRRVKLPAAGSATQEAQQFLGDSVRVVSAFQNIPESLLHDPLAPVECDVLVCGNDREAKRAAIRLAELAGMRAFDGGPIENSVVAEALTSVLINLNIRYKVHGAGFRFTRLPE
ncbi:MAG: NADPH-dependent F420 reductase [Anaerolineae bacterium]|nr:NADPH-dependent F420 reductase [Anaerolineae bacterium]